MAKTMVVYDSVFGNTAQVADAIGEALGAAAVKRVAEVTQADLADVEFLLVGSPTRGFRPTEGIMKFLKNFERGSLQGVKAAAFDTRIAPEDIKSGILRFLITLAGYADKKIEKGLSRAGADIALESTGFGVEGTEGPLKEGELERAKNWAKGIQ